MSIEDPSPERTLAPIGPMLWRQLQAEVLRLWRTPSFLISSLVLPSILFSFFGLRKAGVINGVDSHTYALASVASYGIISVMLYSFGVGIANERAQRVNVLMRATPLPATVYLLAKVVTALLAALATLLILSSFAFFVSDVQLSGAAWTQLIASLVVGALPFIALGFAIGHVVNPTAAAPIINLSFFTLSFASGIFIPLSQLPDIIQNIAPYLPPYQLAQLAWNAIGVSTGSISNALWLLLFYGIVFIALAILAYRREEQRSFS